MWYCIITIVLMLILDWSLKLSISVFDKFILSLFVNTKRWEITRGRQVHNNSENVYPIKYMSYTKASNKCVNSRKVSYKISRWHVGSVCVSPVITQGDDEYLIFIGHICLLLCIGKAQGAWYNSKKLGRVIYFFRRLVSYQCLYEANLRLDRLILLIPRRLWNFTLILSEFIVFCIIIHGCSTKSRRIRGENTEFRKT